jgi:hypothetical protein
MHSNASIVVSMHAADKQQFNLGTHLGPAAPEGSDTHSSAVECQSTKDQILASLQATDSKQHEQNLQPRLA